MAASPVSKPASRSKGRTRSAVCVLCQGPYRIPVVFLGQKFCRFCFDHLKNKGAINQPSLEDDSKVKKKEAEKEEDTEENEEVCTRLCSEHGGNLIWFCVQETALLCEVCKASEDHASHTVVPLEDAAQEYKGKLQNAVDLLKQHLKVSEEQAYQEGKKTAIWKDEVHSQKERIISEFYKLHDFLGDEEERLLKELKEEKRQTLKKLHKNLEQLSVQRSSLKQLVEEVKRKSQQPDTELLKDVENILSRTRNVTRVKTETVSAELKNVYNIPCIDIIEILTKFKVDVTLDLATAHPSLAISKDKKSVKYGGRQQPELLAKENNAERFDTYLIVLGSERFTLGRHYWEVEVGESTEWDLGVCRETVSRKGQVSIMSPLSGFWRLWLWNGDQYKAVISRPTLLPINVKPTRVGIFLDYSEGEISFYNVTDKTHIYTYVGTFNTPMRPFFSPSRYQIGEKAYPLAICPGPRNGSTGREANLEA